MGADSFLAFYGVKVALDPDDEETLDACGDGTDSRCMAARRAGLETFTGRMTDGDDSFLYIGHRLAWLGLEHDSYAALDMRRLAEIAAEVDAKLAAAGLGQGGALHVQLIGRY